MSLIRTSDGFPVVKCSELIVKPTTTTFKWDHLNKNPQLVVSGAKDVARTLNQSGYKGIRGNISLLLGTDEKSWVYGVINTGCIHVGLVDATQSFSTVEGALIDLKLDVKELDSIVFYLTSTEFIIVHSNEIGLIKKYLYPLTSLVGQTAWFWVSSAPGFRLGVWLYENLQSSLKLSEDGKLLMEIKEISTGGLDIKDSCIEFKGANGTNKITIGDGLTQAFAIRDNEPIPNTYMNFNTTGGLEQIELGFPLDAGSSFITTTGQLNGGQLTVDQLDLNDACIAFTGASGANKLVVPDTLVNALEIKDGSNSFIITNGSIPQLEFGVPLDGGANTITTTGTITGGDLVVDDVKVNDSCIEFAGGANKIVFPDNISNALTLESTTAEYLNFHSLTGSENIELLQPLNTTQKITGGCFAVDQLTLDADTLSSLGDIKLVPSGEVLLPADPVLPLAAATKQYVDALAQGLDPKESVRVATAVALPVYVQSGAGVGATLTATANGSLNIVGIDGVTNLVVGNRVLVNNNGAAALDTGIYDITQLGDGSNPWILTRSVDADDGLKLSAASYVFVEEGTTCADSGWVMTTNDPIVIDTTPLNWVKFSQAGVIVGTNVGGGAGVFRDKTGTTLNFKTLFGSTTLTIANNANDISLDVDQSQITGTGALDAGSITANFGSIDNGSSPITTLGTVNAGRVDVDDLTIDGNTLSTIGAADLKLSPNGLGEVLLKADPLSALGAVTKQYVDNFGIILDGVNLGAGAGVFAQNNGSNLEFKTLTNGDGLLSLSATATEIKLDVNELSLTGTGALDAGSITTNFGSINNGASTITTTGKITGGCLDVDNLRLDGNSLVSLDTNGNISLLPQGTGEVLLKDDPLSALGAATKGYVDEKTAILDNTLSIFETQKLTASDGKLDDRLQSVSISGNTAIAGVPLNDTGGPGRGATYFFEFINGVWIQTQKVQASDAQDGDNFGGYVSIDGNYAIVGANKEYNPAVSGAVYFFEKIGNTWVEVAKRKASDAQSGDEFGISVGISGNYAVVGAFLEDSTGSNAGSVYIFERIAGVWTEVQKVQASDAQVGDQFGLSVAICGEYIAVGAILEDTGGINQGSVYIFERLSGTWTEVQKIQAPDAQNRDLFGINLDISGTHIIVGSRDEDSGGANAGSGYIFERISNTWVFISKLLPSDNGVNDRYGTAVAIDGDLALIGSQLDDEKATDAGAVWVFRRDSQTNQWSEYKKLTASDAQGNDRFGSGIAISGRKAIISAVFEDSKATDAGAVYFYNVRDDVKITKNLEIGSIYVPEKGLTIVRNDDPYIRVNPISKSIEFQKPQKNCGIINKVILNPPLPYNIQPGDHTISTNHSVGTGIINLPQIGTPGGEIGREYLIVRNNTGGTVNITPHGSNGIEGLALGAPTPITAIYGKRLLMAISPTRWIFIS